MFILKCLPLCILMLLLWYLISCQYGGKSLPCFVVSMVVCGSAVSSSRILPMQEARQKLVDKNSVLRAKHAAIGDQLMVLARLDLVQQRKRWFASVENIRRIFHRAEGEFSRDLQVSPCRQSPQLCSVGWSLQNALRDSACMFEREHRHT